MAEEEQAKVQHMMSSMSMNGWSYDAETSILKMPSRLAFEVLHGYVANKHTPGSIVSTDDSRSSDSLGFSAETLTPGNI